MFQLGPRNWSINCDNRLHTSFVKLNNHYICLNIYTSSELKLDPIVRQLIYLKGPDCIVLYELPDNIKIYGIIGVGEKG